MIKTKKNGLLNAQPSYVKLNRKKQLNSLVKIQREEEQSEIINKNSKKQFNFKVQTQGNQSRKQAREAGSLLKKYMQTRSRQKQMAFLHGTTPFQSRKIMQKNKTTKTLSKILEKNRMEQKLKEDKKNYLMVNELSMCRKQTEQKASENIRQTDTTLKEDLNCSNNMLKLSQSNVFDEQKRLLNSWVFHNNHVDFKNKNKNDNDKGNNLKNTKMTLKQLWKAKFELGLEDQKHGHDVSSIKSKSRDKVRQKITIVGTKKQKRQQQRKEAIFPRQSTIHSKKKPKTSSYYQYPEQISSSALKVKSCPFQKSLGVLNFQARNKSICWSSSETKLEKRESIQKPSPKYKSNHSCKKIKTEQNYSKEVSGWQYVNDFSERQHFF